MILYVLHDVKAETFSFPQTTNNEATAIREFERLCHSPNFPKDDIKLIKVADFDPKTAGISVDNRLILEGKNYEISNPV